MPSFALFFLNTYPLLWNDPECHSQWQVVPFVLGLAWPRRSSSLDWVLGPTYTLIWLPGLSPPQILQIDILSITKVIQILIYYLKINHIYYYINLLMLCYKIYNKSNIFNIYL